MAETGGSAPRTDTRGGAAPAGAWRVEAVGPESPEARALVAASESELSALYASEHRNALSVEALVALGADYVVARDPAGRALAGGGLAVLADDGRYGELKRLVTLPEARRRGAARAVVAALEALARTRGLRLMRLETGEASPEAIALYARLGYRRRGPFGRYAENGSSVFMEKRLEGGP